MSWSAAQRLGGQAVQAVVFLVLARLLDAREFGLLSLVAVYVNFLQVFVEQGVGDAVVQRPEATPAFVHTAFWLNLASGTALGLLGWWGAPLSAAVLHQPELVPVVRAMSLLFPLTALTVVPLALLRREMRFRTLAFCTLLQAACGGLAAVWLAARGAGVWCLVGQQFAAAGAGIAFLLCRTLWRPGFVVCRRAWKELFWFGGNVTGVNVLNLFNRQADNLIIGWFLGPVALGYYAVAYQILLNVSNLFVGTINGIALPLLARLQHDRPRFREAVFGLTTLACLVSAPFFYGLAALAPDALTVCLGGKWAASAPTLQVLCLVGLLYAGFYFHGPILTALGKPHWNLVLNALQAAGNAVAFLVGVRWGIVGVAAAYVLRAYLTAPIHLWVLRREAGITMGDYLRRFLPAGAASAVMMLGLVAVRFVLPPTLPPAASLALAVGAGGALYLATALALEPRLRGLLRRFVPRPAPAAVAVTLS